MHRKRPLLKDQEQLLTSRSTSSLQTLLPSEKSSPKPFEYEDIFNTTKSPIKLTDILARESDVIISHQISPLTEYRGYGLYLLGTLFHTVWLLWTFLPKPVLNYLGVYYYPSRWWSLSISSFILMGMLYTYIALQFWNIEYETVPLDDVRTIIDDDAVVEKDIDQFGWRATNGVFDLRITDVNNVLYN